MRFGKRLADAARSLGVRLAWVPAAACAVALASPAVAAAPGQFGTIKGRLVWGGADVPKPQSLEITKDTEVCKPAGMEHVAKELLVDPKTKGVGNAFAYIALPKGENPDAEKALLEKASEIEIDQKACEFLPYSTAIHKDQQLVFKSSDPVNHNVRYNAFKNSSYNQMLPPQGKVQVKLVAETRPLPLTCDIHPWMKGAIMVFDHPFFAVTKEDGTFEIRGVPAGTQNLVVRFASGKFITPGQARGTPVTVSPGGVTDIGEVKIDPASVK